jgi:hypothetical protein
MPLESNSGGVLRSGEVLRAPCYTRAADAGSKERAGKPGRPYPADAQKIVGRRAMPISRRDDLLQGSVTGVAPNVISIEALAQGEPPLGRRSPICKGTIPACRLMAWLLLFMEAGSNEACLPFQACCTPSTGEVNIKQNTPNTASKALA